jgi:uncharacterized protein (DUF1684 family)
VTIARSADIINSLFALFGIVVTLRVSKPGLALLALAIRATCADEAYLAEIQKWRQESDTFMRSEKSPLRLVGRFKLEEGVSTLGSDPASTAVFPERAPKQAGTITRHGGAFSFEAAAGIPAAINGQPVNRSTVLQVAKNPKPSDRMSVGDFTFAVRPAGDDFYLLLQDSQSAFLREFKGRTWFPIDPAYTIEAQFSPYEKEQEILVPYTTGSAEPFKASGDVIFQLMGQTLRLRVFVQGQNLFVMFRDQTSARETYGGGRYLEAAVPQNGKTVLDFNKAYNPYCAFSPYANCPIPPRQNRLPVPIAAGETYVNH